MTNTNINTKPKGNNNLKSNIKYRIMVEYEVPESEIENFIKATLPYGKFLKYQKVNKNITGRIPDKVRKNREEIAKTKIYNFLSHHKSADTTKLFNCTKQIGSRRNFVRFLMKLALLNYLEVEKVPKERGGYRNIWKLKQ